MCNSFPVGKITEKAVCRSVFYALLQTIFFDDFAQWVEGAMIHIDISGLISEYIGNIIL